MSPSDLTVGIQQLGNGKWKVEAWNESHEWSAIDSAPLNAYRKVYREMREEGATQEELDKLQRIATDPDLKQFCEIIDQRRG